MLSTDTSILTQRFPYPFASAAADASNGESTDPISLTGFSSSSSSTTGGTATGTEPSGVGGIDGTVVIDEKIWWSAAALECALPVAFLGLTAALTAAPEDWLAYLHSTSPHTTPLPQGWHRHGVQYDTETSTKTSTKTSTSSSTSSLTSSLKVSNSSGMSTKPRVLSYFQQILLVKTFREEKLYFAIQEFVRSYIGKNLI